MANATLTIQVSEEAARALRKSHRKINAKSNCCSIFGASLTISPPPRKSLQTVMDEIGKNVAVRGLTPDGSESLPNNA